MGNKRTLEWTPLREVHFCKLKERLSTAPILQYPQANRTYQVETDALDTAIGGVLWIMTPGGTFLPVAYKSWRLTDREQHYPIHDKELLAIYHCLKKCNVTSNPERIQSSNGP